MSSAFLNVMMMTKLLIILLLIIIIIVLILIIIILIFIAISRLFVGLRMGFAFSSAQCITTMRLFCMFHAISCDIMLACQIDYAFAEL